MGNTLKQDYDAALAQIDALKAAGLEDAKRIATLQSAGEAAAKENADLKAAAAKVEVEHKAALELIAAERDALKVEKEALATELANAKKTLENPAFKAAQADGQKQATAEGGQPPVVVPMTQAEAEAELKKITDPVARAKFRAEHMKELGA